ncbi:MAG: putative glucose-fructose oxidoreductase oxidoreductase protein [Burkholderiales bacterium]|jgi:glucose-fructose oxidoreductase|nr:putative glucose-fructose oxidoreductase oxidoreductase protein [Burkholderiales bacterium]
MPKRLIRYAVVGLGHIAQVAVLPAFGNARRNSRLAAIVSGDPVKREQVQKKYAVPNAYAYDEYDRCLASGEVDAVYLALPNHLHCDYAERAARAGVHVLCEKPMALDEAQCERMAAAARAAGVKLMVAYRLHFERANLEAIETARSGRIGEPRLFNSTFVTPVVPGNIRVRRETGGGVLWDVGIYCINAARGLFRDEPIEVGAATAGRLDEVEESVSCWMRFPNERLASFTASFGAAKVSSYRIAGTKGDLAVDPAYEYAKPLKHRLTIDGEVRERRFAKRDQFAPELLYFSDCVLQNRDPEPSAEEGLADVRIIRALYRAAESGHPVALAPFERRERQSLEQEIRRPPIDKPQVVHAEAPSGAGGQHP